MIKYNRKLSQVIKLFNLMPNWFMKAISNINNNQKYIHHRYHTMKNQYLEKVIVRYKFMI